MKIIIVGGGAAGFFFASQAAQKFPKASVKILEQGKEVLVKVRISGGGRCNLTHHCFDAKELTRNYPRGGKELLGPFYRFGPSDTIEWFESRGVETKVESDGRMFPKSDRSQSVIDCLIKESKKVGTEIHLRHKVVNISPLVNGENGFDLILSNGRSLHADILFMATGSSKSAWGLLSDLDINVVSPVPSLFTFIISDPILKELSGISIDDCRIEIPKWSQEARGPLLITHKGLSGPAVLKLSSHAARQFYEANYQTPITVDLCPEVNTQRIKELRTKHARKTVSKTGFLNLPKRLCHSIIKSTTIDPEKKFADLSNLELHMLESQLKKLSLKVEGQNKFKDEFVTSGGVDLKEINFTSFQSKKFQNLYIAGEALNIDAVTGGFNFQAAWTGAYIAAEHLSQKIED